MINTQSDIREPVPILFLVILVAIAICFSLVDLCGSTMLTLFQD